MFKKFARLENRSERLEIYNLLKLNLEACLRLSELLAMAALIAALARPLSDYLTAAWGPTPGAMAAIALMLLLPGGLRLPFLLLADRLAADFGLDPRPAGRRLKSLLQLGLRRLALVWAVSVFLFLVPAAGDPRIWALVALGLALSTLDAFFPSLWRPAKLRPLQEGELPPKLLARLDSWAGRTGLNSARLAVDRNFSPDLEGPRLAGLGPTLRLVIQEKSLAAFTPREMDILVIAAVLGALIKAPLKFLLLRFCSLVITVSLAAILISTLGVGLWGYPLVNSPALIVLVWAAAWIGHWAAELSIRLTRRTMATQLAAAASTLIRDEEALETALATLADKNLEEENTPAWRELFRLNYSRRAFLKKAKFHQHLARSNGER